MYLIRAKTMANAGKTASLELPSNTHASVKMNIMVNNANVSALHQERLLE